MKIKNITLRDFFSLPEIEKEKINFAIKFGSQFREIKDFFNVGDFTFLPFGTIKDLQFDLSKEFSFEKYLEHLEKILKVEKKCFFENYLLDLYQFQNYVFSEINRINEIEKALLTSYPSIEEVEAGIDTFNELGIYMEIRELTGGKIWRNKKIRESKYTDALLELVARKKLNDYNSKRQEIYNKKNK